MPNAWIEHIKNFAKANKQLKWKSPCKTPPEVSKLLNTIGLDSTSSFINSRSSCCSKSKSSFSSKSSHSNIGSNTSNQTTGRSD